MEDSQALPGALDQASRWAGAGLLRTFKQEAPYLARSLPQLPAWCSGSRQPARATCNHQLESSSPDNWQNRWLAFITVLLGVVTGVLLRRNSV